MNQCPYPERNINRGSARIETNRLYLAWQEGYEAHKFEVAHQSIKLANLVVQLETRMKDIEKLKRELEKQRTKS